jgi:hypothetical protein
MEQLEEMIMQKESSFINTVTDILSQSCSNRVKMALISKQYFKCLVAIDDLVIAAKIEAPQVSAVDSN